jgi:hypothetical protein
MPLYCNAKVPGDNRQSHLIRLDDHSPNGQRRSGGPGSDRQAHTSPKSPRIFVSKRRAGAIKGRKPALLVVVVRLIPI